MEDSILLGWQSSSAFPTTESPLNPSKHYCKTLQANARFICNGKNSRTM